MLRSTELFKKQNKQKSPLETLAPLQTQGTVYKVELAQAIRQWLQGVIT